MRYPKAAILTFVFALVAVEATQAYVGPGAGLSLLGALWGLIVAVGAALLFLILWPLRRARRRARARQAAGEAAVVPTGEEQAAVAAAREEAREPARPTAR